MSLMVLISSFIFLASEFFPTIYYHYFPNEHYDFSDPYVLVSNILMATSYNIFPFIYIFKTARIYYAFETNAKNRFWNGFFNKERYMVIMTLILGFMSTGYIQLYDTDFFMNPFSNKKKIDSPLYMWKYFGMGQCFLFALMLFLLRNIKKEYNITKEIFIILIFSTIL